MRRVPLLALGLVLAVVLSSGCERIGRPDLPEPSVDAEETTKTAIFFSTGRSLLQEDRVVDARDPEAAALKELLDAEPRLNPDVAVVQPVAKVRSVKLADGVLTIDWSREVLDFEAEPREKVLALAAVLRTMGEFSQVEKVRFTVEGRESGSLGGKDVERFWGRVSLKGQPWPVLRAQEATAAEEP